MSKVWFVTGASSGFGRSIVVKALEAGEQVVATARKPEQMADLLAQYPDNLRTLALDVTDPAQVKSVVAEAVAQFGRLDVVVNNAGYGLMGALEECDEAQLRRSLETNFFGPLLVMQAVMPFLRAQKSGHIINMSAIAALTNHAGFTVYGGAKAALDAASDALRLEAGPLGVKVTGISPGPFRTDFVGRSMEQATSHLEEYDKTSGKFASYLHKIDGIQPGNPAAAAAAIVQMVQDGKAPTQLYLGKYANEAARKKIALMLRELDEWEAVSLATDFAR